MKIRHAPHNGPAPGHANGHRSALPAPSPMKNCQPFSNDRLNFKHSFWAARGPEKGIFAAFHRSRADQFVRSGRNPATTQLLIVAESHSTACSSSTSPTPSSSNYSPSHHTLVHL